MDATGDCVRLTPEWAAWKVLNENFQINPRVFFELLEGGQSFQWYRDAQDGNGEGIGGIEGFSSWSGIVDSDLVGLGIDPDGFVYFRTSTGFEDQIAQSKLHKYLRVAEAHADYLEDMPLDQDEYLQSCVEAFPGLRILRQPIEKVILTFLCSSNKRIPQIKQMLWKLSAKFGTEVSAGWYDYPTWETLANADLESVLTCGTGYRGKYILGSARIIHADSGYFERLDEMSYQEAKLKLLELPGVGEKVADCILLYGGGRYEAFPLDTWILKALETRYGLKGFSRKEMLQWANEHFGKFAGIAQQYIFAWERDVKVL